MSDALRARIEDALYGRYGYVDVECLNEIVAVIAETPEPHDRPETEREKAYNRVPKNLPGMVARPKPNPKGIALHTFLLTEAKRELDDTLEAPNANNLRNALMSVIRAIEALAK